MEVEVDDADDDNGHRSTSNDDFSGLAGIHS